MGSRKSKRIAAVLFAVVLLASSVGTAYAYLSTGSDPVTNTLTPEAAEQPEILEHYTKTEKRDVCVDVGDPGYAVYVRAAIVATWQNEKGEIHWKIPEAGQYVGSGDYYLDWNDGDWFYHGDFYYLKTMVTEGETPNLIDLCSQLVDAPDEGYTLHVEIVAQTIQALGTTDGNSPVPAVTDAWGIPVNGGALEDPS